MSILEKKRIPTQARFARRLGGWSQSEVAAAAGITRGALSQIENGFDEPSPAVKRALSAALDVPADQLLKPVTREQVTGVAA